MGSMRCAVALVWWLLSGCATAQAPLRSEGVVVGGGARTMASGGRVASERATAEVASASSPSDRIKHAATTVASRSTPQLSAVKYSPPRRKGTAIAKRASRLVGVRSLAKVTRRFPDDCTGLVRIAAEPEGVVLMDGNARVSDNGVTAIWRRARANGALHKRKPRPGDLVFFRETYDRNRDGKRNDGLTHIAVVESVASDGTVTFVHRGGKGVSRSRMNVFVPRDKRRNDYLRPAQGKGRAYLTGELFSTYATPDKL